MNKSLLCIAVMTATLGLSACDSTLSEEIENQVLANQPEVDNDSGTENDNSSQGGAQGGVDEDSGAGNDVAQDDTEEGDATQGGAVGGDIAEDDVAEGNVIEDIPVEDIPVEDIPVEDIPVEENPIEENPIEENPIEENPIEENPIEENPADEVIQSNGHSHPKMVGMSQSGAVMHGMSDKRMAEHMTVMELVSHKKVTLASVRSGDWSNPATWGGQLPSVGERILIDEGHQVTVDKVMNTSFRTIRVDGSLTFATHVNTELHVDTMLVNYGAEFIMGSHEAPIHSKVTARLIIEDFKGEGIESTRSNSPDYDPYKLGLGIMAHGKFITHGAEKTGYVALDKAFAGDKKIKLDVVPVNWRAGDDLVLAGMNSDATGDEKLRIKSIDQAKNTIYLNNALSYDHVPPKHNKFGLKLKVHLINTSRNAIIETAEEHRETVFVHNDKNGKHGATQEFTNRGHVMFMHSNNVDISYSGFYHLGRTNKIYAADDSYEAENGDMVIGKNPRARYPVHFHRAGMGGKPAHVLGNAVVNAPGWGYVNHSSHAVMLNNVAYDTSGAGYASEAGDEVGSFINNVSIKSHGSTMKGMTPSRLGARPKNEFGHEGSGFWVHSKAIVLQDNIATGFSHSGFAMFREYIDGAETHMIRTDLINDSNGLYANVDEIVVEDMKNVPFQTMQRNTAYGGNTAMEWSKIDIGANNDFLGYAIAAGEVRWYSSSVTHKNLTYIGNIDKPSGIGIDYNPNSGGTRYYDLHVEGFDIGMNISPRQNNNGTAVKNAYMANITDFHFIKRYNYGHKASVSGDVTFGNLTGKALNGKDRVNFTVSGITHASANKKIPNPEVSTMVIDISDWGQPYRIYMVNEQSPDFVPYPSSLDSKVRKSLPSEWINKNNRWFKANVGMPMNGEYLPNNVQTFSGTKNIGLLPVK